MSVAADLRAWTELWLMLAVGSTAIMALAAVAARLVPGAIWERTVWQVCVLGLGTLILGELTGVARGVVEWARVHAALSDSRVEDLTEPEKLRTQHGTTVETVSHLAGSTAASEIHPVGSQFTSSKVDHRDAGHDFRANMEASGRDNSSAAAGWWGTMRRDPWLADRILYAAGILWLVGAVTILGRLALGQIALLVFRCRNHSVCDAGIGDRLSKLAAVFGLSRIRVVTAEGLLGPIAFGFIWPTIGLPRRFADEFAPHTREAMLAHELAHLAARDPAWFLLGDLVTAVLWWHPGMWWTRHQLRMASEYAADEACLVVRDGPRALAICLVELGRRLTRTTSPDWVRVEGNSLRSGLARRVARLLALAGRSWQPPARGTFLLVKGIGPVAMVAVALTSTAWSQPLVIEKGDPMTHIFRQSWRHSLVAIALVSVFGSVETAALADDPVDLKQKQLEAEERAKEARAAKKEREEVERAEAKEQLQALEREIDELRKAGKLDAAEKLMREFKERAAALDKSAKVREKIYASKEVQDLDKLHAHLKELEGENHRLRELLRDTVGGMRGKPLDLKDRHVIYGEEREVKGKKYADPTAAVYEKLKAIESELAQQLKAGHVKEAKQLEEAAAELRKHAESFPSKDAQPKKHVVNERSRAQVEELKAMIEKLQAAGQREQAEEVARKLQELNYALTYESKKEGFDKKDQPQPTAASYEKMVHVVAELQQQVNRLGAEVAELRRALKETKEPPR